MRGDRHMGTVRSHNRIHRIDQRRAKTLTAKQRRERLHAITNRGAQQGAPMDERDEVETQPAPQGDGDPGDAAPQGDPGDETPTEEAKSDDN